MATKPIACQDEFGQRWMVYEGDAGWAACYQLYRLGAREIVLPRTTVCTGQLTNYEINDKLPTWNVSNPAVAALARRYIRLADCLHVLRGGTDGASGLHPEHVAGSPSTVGTD